MKPTLVFLAFAALSAPLSAGETGWQEIMPDVNIRMISGDALTEDATTWVALEIEMPDDVKTYWRVPGESGIPTHVDFTGSEGVGGATIAWPLPVRDTTDGYLDHAYYGDMVLPIEIETDADVVKLQADVTLGVCSDVCVPVNVSFSQDVDLSTPDRSNALRINQARATVPLPHDGAHLFGAATLDPKTGALTVEVETALDPSDIIAEIEGSMALFDEPNLSADGKYLQFPFLGRPSQLDLGQGRVLLSLPTSDGPIEVARPLGGN